MRPTLDEIYRQGLKALRERLGRAGMIRFLQQFETGKGNYARERHDWVNRVSLKELRDAAERKPSRKRRKKR